MTPPPPRAIFYMAIIPIIIFKKENDMRIRIDPLSLVDRLAAWWLNWRILSFASDRFSHEWGRAEGDAHTERAFKGTPAWEETKLARLEAEANGTMQAILESPSVVIMAQEAARLLDATHAENFFTFEMFPRLDRGVAPIRVTVEWAERNGPVKQLERAKRDLALQERVADVLRAELAQLRGDGAARNGAEALADAPDDLDLVAEEENAGALA